ncbi:MAG: hypothetical protein ACO3LE_10590, partial [Bdellovibrionota bacterium]
HTKFVATYAAFMAARSYQVYGNQSGSGVYQEFSQSDPDGVDLLSGEQTWTIIRTAEDIFTCALPWMSVPEGDELAAFDEALQSKGVRPCLEGKRKYEKTNIDKKIVFYRFENESSNQGDQLLDPVPGAYIEPGREPLRFSIMRMRYRNPMLTGLMEFFGGLMNPARRAGNEAVDEDMQNIYDGRLWFNVHVPALLNPSLNSGVERNNGSSQEDNVAPETN